MLDPILVFSLFVVSASLLGFVAQVFRLPLLLSYIAAGLVLGLFVGVGQRGELAILPEIGVAFLLFLLGIELDIREIKHLGRQIILASSAQMVMTTAAGFLIARLLGFGSSDSFFVGLGLSFSSTIVVIKLFVDRKELASLHGKIAVGILLFEDLVAVLALMFLTLGPSLSGIGLTQVLPLLELFFKGLLLLGGAFVFSRVALPYFFKTAAASAELLFLSGITVCFAFIGISLILGTGIAIGAFLAGLVLASSPYRYHIAGRIKPLRDLFITLFFVDLGLRVAFGISEINLVAILVITIYALFAKPTIFMSILGLLGYKKHTSFLTSIGLSQISEFSLIIAVFAQSLGLLERATFSTLAVSALLTMAASTVALSHSASLYRRVGKILSVFERKRLVYDEPLPRQDLREHILLLGCDRIGRILLPILKKSGHKFLVVDFNPQVVGKLTADGVPIIFGDVSDPEILESLNIPEAKLIISTIGDVHDNALLLEILKRKTKKPIFIAAAVLPDEALRLYEMGADLVLVPHMITGEYIADVLSGRIDRKSLVSLRERQFAHLALERTSYL